MLACFSPVSTKAAADESGEGGEATKQAVAAKHGLRLFTFQLKQMASRFTSGALYRHCRPTCTTLSRHDLPNDNPAVHPSSEEVQSPQFSLKSYQMNEHTPSRKEGSATPENHTSVATKAIMRSLQSNLTDCAENEEATNSENKTGPELNEDFHSEWVAQVEPGVYITFCAAPDGFNDLKRIKFSRAMFGTKQHAESWWTENCPMIRELYNVRPPSSTNADEDRLSSGYATPDPYSKSPCSTYNGGDYQLTRRKSAADARYREEPRGSDSQTREDAGKNNAWVEQDEAGVYLTILTLPAGGKQLKRVRFSRDKFSEGQAAAWWERNRQRVYAQHIFTTTRLQAK